MPFTLEEYQWNITRLFNQAFHGCSNHGCEISPPEGMGTNSSCNCTPTRLAKKLRQIAQNLDTVQTWRRNN